MPYLMASTLFMSEPGKDESSQQFFFLISRAAYNLRKYIPFPGNSVQCKKTMICVCACMWLIVQPHTVDDCLCNWGQSDLSLPPVYTGADIIMFLQLSVPEICLPFFHNVPWGLCCCWVKVFVIRFLHHLGFYPKWVICVCEHDSEDL